MASLASAPPLTIGDEDLPLDLPTLKGMEGAREVTKSPDESGARDTLESNFPGSMPNARSLVGGTFPHHRHETATSASSGLTSSSQFMQESARLGYSYGQPHQYDIKHCKWWGDILKSLTGS